jgi:hypothetical protein
VIKKPRERGGHSPRWAAEREKIIIIIMLNLQESSDRDALNRGHTGNARLNQAPRLRSASSNLSNRADFSSKE